MKLFIRNLLGVPEIRMFVGGTNGFPMISSPDQIGAEDNAVPVVLKSL